MKHLFRICFVISFSLLGGCEKAVVMTDPDPEPEPKPFVAWEALYWLEFSSATNQGLFLADDTLRLRQIHPDTLVGKNTLYIRRSENQYIAFSGAGITLNPEADTLTYRDISTYGSRFARGRKVSTWPDFFDRKNELDIQFPRVIWFDSLATYENRSSEVFRRFVWVFPFNPSTGAIQTFTTVGAAPLKMAVRAEFFQPFPVQDSSTFLLTLRGYRPDGTRTDRTFLAKAQRKK